MSQITILSLYILAGALLAGVRLRARYDSRAAVDAFALLLAALGIVLHAITVGNRIFVPGTFDLGLNNVLSLLAWEIAVIALLGAHSERYRGVAAILLLVAGPLSAAGLLASTPGATSPLGLPLEIHAVTSLLAHSLIAVGAVLAGAALVQDRRLRAARPGGWIELLPPLSAMERLIFAVAIVGFVGLLLSIATGFVFVENLFAQHLIHKTVLSLLALVLFGALIIGRLVAGWRGRPALYLYLGGFATLVLAYIGSKFVLEVLLGRQWG